MSAELVAAAGLPPELAARFDRRHRLQRLAAALLLVALAPVLVLLALAVVLTSRGPVLFRQPRLGQYGQPFALLKFRSMRPPAAVHRVGTAGGLAPGGVEGEDRRTRVGRVMRRYGLDELPQLVNVVRGEMALVGPRPERPDFARRYDATLPAYGLRLCVRPGITGLAQVRGLRGQTPLDARLATDLEYLTRCDRRTDAAILVRTVAVVLRGLE